MFSIRQGFRSLLKGHDAVISAVHFTASDPVTLIEAVRASGVPRYLVVGGAGSLEIAPGQRVVDLPDFPAAYKAEATKGAEFLDRLRGEKQARLDLPVAIGRICAGERTGKFRIGKDELLSNAEGSRISFEDYAIALVDEIEKPQHSRQRFTVGY